MPPATTTTLPLCAGGGGLDPLAVTIGKLRGAGGDESFAITGGLDVPAAVPLVPVETGLQVLLEDVGDDARRMLDLTAETGTAIPGGAPGTGCHAKDGWTKLGYRNQSTALDPPACTAGTAGGLRTIRLKDRRARGKGIAFRIVGRGARIGAPTGPLRVTLVLGADPAAGVEGACATRTFDPGACRARRGGFRCR